MLLDVTDPPTADQAGALEDRLSQIIEKTLRPGDGLTVWVLGQSPEGPLYRVARMTLPPRDSNPLFQNPRRTREHYDARVARPLHQILAERLPHGRAPLRRSLKRSTRWPNFPTCEERASGIS